MRMGRTHSHHVNTFLNNETRFAANMHSQTACRLKHSSGRLHADLVETGNYPFHRGSTEEARMSKSFPPADIARTYSARPFGPRYHLKSGAHSHNNKTL